MILSDGQIDALSEVINIAFGRAAASLSQLTEQRVTLEVPNVTICPIADLNPTLTSLVHGDLATVHQIFTGPVAGDALLLLSRESAAHLVDLLLGQDGSMPQLDESAREVMAEVGNILLSACLGMFGNLLQVRVTFSVPRLELSALDALLRSLTIGQQELRYALVVSTSFKLRDSEIGGFLVIVLGVASFDRLLQAVEKLE